MLSRQFPVALYMMVAAALSHIVNAKRPLFNCLFAFKIVVKVFIHCKQYNLNFFTVMRIIYSI